MGLLANCNMSPLTHGTEKLAARRSVLPVTINRFVSRRVIQQLNIHLLSEMHSTSCVSTCKSMHREIKREPFKLQTQVPCCCS